MRWNRLRICAAIAAMDGCVALAQENAPIGLLHGDLVAWAGTVRSGELTFRNSDSHLYQCSFDAKTYFEHANERISIAAMHQGDPVEVLADHKDATGACYARTIQLLDGKVVGAAPGQRPRLRTAPGATEMFAPRGDLTFAGVVLRIEPNVLVLRTRTNQRRTIQLRPDTRFLSAGQALDRSSLPVATTVFIRGGRNLDGDVEAYQVVWGEILEP